MALVSWALTRLVLVLLVVFTLFGSSTSLVNGKTYTIDFVPPILNETEPILSLAVRGGRNINLENFNNADSLQRFIARINEDNTFNLFMETQRWNWVEHIVERTQTVKIDMHPRVVEGIGALTRTVVYTDYTGSDSQRWYIVPSGDDPNVGLITNLLHKMCMVGNGRGAQLTLAICSFTDPKQQFKFIPRTPKTCSE